MKLNSGFYSQDPERTYFVSTDDTFQKHLDQCFSTAGPRPGTGPWHQLYRAARGM